MFTRHVNLEQKSDTTAAVFTSSTKFTEDGSKEGLRNSALLLLIAVVDIRHIAPAIPCCDVRRLANGNSDEDSSRTGCDVVSLGESFVTFRMIVMQSKTA